MHLRILIASAVFAVTGCQTVEPGRTTTAAAPTALMATSPGPAQPAVQMKAHFIDVGQGACTLLEFPCGVVLVDTGSADDPRMKATPNTDHLMQYLEKFFARRKDLKNTIDLVVISHPHSDHTFGLTAVTSKYSVKHYVDSGLFATGSGKHPVQAFRRKVAEQKLPTTIRAVTVHELERLPQPTGISDPSVDPIACARCDPKLTVLHGAWANKDGAFDGLKKFENANDNSVVLRVDFGDTSFLLTGDLQTAGIGSLLSRYTKTGLLDVDVYLVGHHGSHNATTPEFLQAITPQIAVIPVGHWTDGSRYKGDRFNTVAFGHARQLVVQLLTEHVSTTREKIDVQVATGVNRFVPQTITKAVYATGWDGDVVVTANLTQIVDITRSPKPEVALTAEETADVAAATGP